MNVRELYDALGDLIEQVESGNLPDDSIIDGDDLKVHFQPGYPLEGGLMNFRMLDGKPVLAIGDGYEYGDKRAWDDPDHDE